MFDLLKNFYNKVEDIKGKRLLYTLVGFFIFFLFIGASVGYLISPRLSNNENGSEEYIATPEEPQKIEMEGKIVYENPDKYPMDDVSFVLVDSSGEDIILLSAKDQKLSIAENLTVKVVGKMSKLSDKKTDVLIVDEVKIKSATN